MKKLGGGDSSNPKNPIITPEALVELDGFLIGAPTRFGRMPAQVGAFLDGTGAQYAAGSLVGKFAGTFTSSNSQHGGQETTHLNIFPYFAHQGIIFVPNGYQFPFTGDTSHVHGASPYGASTVAGSDGKLQPSPSPQELEVATAQGKVSQPSAGAEPRVSRPVVRMNAHTAVLRRGRRCLPYGQGCYRQQVEFTIVERRLVACRDGALNPILVELKSASVCFYVAALVRWSRYSYHVSTCSCRPLPHGARLTHCSGINELYSPNALPSKSLLLTHSLPTPTPRPPPHGRSLQRSHPSLTLKLFVLPRSLPPGKIDALY